MITLQRWTVTLAILLVGGSAAGQVPAATSVPGKYAAAGADRSTLEILVQLPAGAQPGDLEVTGLPKSSIESVQPFAALSSHTVFVIDGSGSFRGARTQESKQVLGQWANVRTLDALHTAQVIVFGDKLAVGEVRSTRADFDRDVEELLDAGAPGSTMLYTGLERGVDLALASGKALRSVWIFTDGGDSSKGLTEEALEPLITKAASDRVRVFMATPAAAKANWSEYLTRLGKVVSATSGTDLVLGGTSAAAALMKSLLDEESKLSLVVARPCGLSQTAQLQVTIQHVPSKSSTNQLPVRNPAWSPAVFKSCCDPVQCTGWQACAGNDCEPRACDVNGDCGQGAHCVAGHCALGDDPVVAPHKPPEAEDRQWLWLVGAGVLAVVLAAWLADKGRAARAAKEKEAQLAREAEALKKAEEERLREAQQQNAKAASAVPITLPRPPGGPVEELPEFHLIVQLGPGDMIGKRFRLARRSTLVGSAATNQIVIDMPGVSSEHAEFQLYPTGTVYVKDLNSTNGVVVDGGVKFRNERREIKPGAQVSLGKSVRLELFRPGASVARPSGEAAAPSAEPQSPSVPPAKKSTVFDRN